MSKNLTTKNLFKKAEIDHISNISSARFSARQSSNKSLDTLPPDFRVENHPLDSEQRKAIYDPARFNLTVAGAGSGKTTTILGKILYLLQSGFASPPEILVLSFTHDSATELRERFCANIIKHLRNRFCSENLRHPILRLRPSIV